MDETLQRPEGVTDREWEIYLLRVRDCQTLAAIADRFGITRWRVAKTVEKVAGIPPGLPTFPMITEEKTPWSNGSRSDGSPS